MARRFLGPDKEVKKVRTGGAIPKGYLSVYVDTVDEFGRKQRRWELWREEDYNRQKFLQNV